MIKFTESTKWRDPWFRKLKTGEKLVFMFLCDNCDNGGFYEIDKEFMAFSIGCDEIQIEGAIKGLDRGLTVVGEWIWIKKYLKHQRNIPLNPDNNAHRQIIYIIQQKLSLFPEIPKILGANQGLFSPIGKGNSRGKGKGKNKDLIVYSKEFNHIWQQYPNQIGKKEAYKHYKASMLTAEDQENILKALGNYKVSKRVQDGHIQDGSTWFNNWHDWINYKTIEKCKRCNGTGEYMAEGKNGYYKTVCSCRKDATKH